MKSCMVLGGIVQHDCASGTLARFVMQGDGRRFDGDFAPVGQHQRVILERVSCLALQESLQWSTQRLSGFTIP